MIHICFCFCDKTGFYSKFPGTAMLSVFENTRSAVTVHILHDNTLTADNRDKFSYLAGKYGQFVNFYNLDEICPEKIEEIVKLIPEIEKAKVTVGAFYKLLIPQILPKKIERAIFLDPDTIVNLDIDELWRVDLSNRALAVVAEVANGINSKEAFLLCSEGIVQAEDFFNCGVLLMNLEILREEEETIAQGLKFRSEHPEQKFLEQIVLNYGFSTRTLKLPIKFNCFVKWERRNKADTCGKKIYHYSNGSSRMGLDMNDPASQLWMSYFIKTPWFDENAAGRLYVGLQKIRNNLKDSSLKLATIVPGKMRAFFVEPSKVEEVTTLFSIKDHEEVILAQDENSVQNLIDAMQASMGVCVFFIMTEKILKKKFPLNRLKEAGFTEDKHFVKGWTLLSRPLSAPHESYSLVEIM